MRIFSLIILVLTMSLSPRSIQARSSELDKGIQQYESADFEGTIQSLKPVVADIRVPAERATGYLYLGCAHLGLERVSKKHLAEAQESFRLVLQTKPDFQLPSAMKSHPKIAPLFGEARKRWTAELTVQASPPEAQIQLDGQTVGSGAIKVRVFVGTHTVTAVYQRQKMEKSVQLDGSEQKTVALEIPLIIHTPPRDISVNQPIGITVKLSSQMEPETVNIYYMLNSASNWQDEKMHFASQPEDALRIYKATLPSQSHVCTLRYYIRAKYPSDVQAQSPNEQKYHQIKIVDTTPPRIETTPIQRARINESITIKAQIKDNTSVDSAEVYYAESQAPVELSDISRRDSENPIGIPSEPRIGADFRRLSLAQTSPGEYVATLPPQSRAGQILYYLAVTDEGDNVSYYPEEGAKAPLRFKVIDDSPQIQTTIAQLEKISNQADKKREEITHAIQQVKSQIQSAAALTQASKQKQDEKVLANASAIIDKAKQQGTELSSLLSSLTEVAEKGRLAVTFPDSREKIDAKAESLKKVMQQANAAVSKSLSEVQADLEQIINQLASGGLELTITVNNAIVSKPIRVSMECLPQALEKIPNHPLKIDNLPIGTHNIHIELSHWLTADIPVTIEKDQYAIIHHNFLSGALRVQIPHSNVLAFLDEQPPGFIEENNFAIFEYVSLEKHKLKIIYPDGSFQQEVIISSSSPVTVYLSLPEKKKVKRTKERVADRSSSPSEKGVGALELWITPTHAAIFLDDKPVGYGSRAFPKLSTGWHTITVKAEGYRLKRIMVNIQAGTILRRAITLSHQ